MEAILFVHQSELKPGYASEFQYINKSCGLTSIWLLSASHPIDTTIRVDDGMKICREKFICFKSLKLK